MSVCVCVCEEVWMCSRGLGSVCVLEMCGSKPNCRQVGWQWSRRVEEEETRALREVRFGQSNLCDLMCSVVYQCGKRARERCAVKVAAGM